MKKIVSLIVVVAVVAAGIVFLPRLLHGCDNCGKFFVGTGYSANVVSSLVTDILDPDAEDKILCKECAEKSHAVAIGLGGSVEDYKLPLFGE